MRSAVKRVAELLKDEPERSFLDLQVSTRLNSANSLALGLVKRFANIRSDFWRR
jgi:hypothetical protein